MPHFERYNQHELRRGSELGSIARGDDPHTIPSSLRSLQSECMKPKHPSEKYKADEEFEIPQDVMDATFEKMERLRPFFAPFPIMRSETSEQIMYEKKIQESDRISALEERIEQLEKRLNERPSILILGEAVSKAWDELTRRKK